MHFTAFCTFHFIVSVLVLLLLKHPLNGHKLEEKWYLTAHSFPFTTGMLRIRIRISFTGWMYVNTHKEYDSGFKLPSTQSWAKSGWLSVWDQTSSSSLNQQYLPVILTDLSYLHFSFFLNFIQCLFSGISFNFFSVRLERLLSLYRDFVILCLLLLLLL